MRLVEIAPNFVRSQTGTLMTILQHLEDKVGKGTTVPFSAISNLMHNVGYIFTYDDLKVMHAADLRIQALITDFDQEEITIGKAEELPSEDDDLLDAGEPQADKIVNKLSKKAAKAINK